MSSKCNGCLSGRRQLKAKILPCPCPCETCKKKRASGGMDRAQSVNAGGEGGKGGAKLNFVGFFTEAMGIIAFFIIATIMFWLSVTYYIFQLSMKIYRSDRNTQNAAFILVLLLGVSISISLISKNLKNKYKAKAAATAAAAANAAATTDGSVPAASTDKPKATPDQASATATATTPYHIPSKSGEKIQLVPKVAKATTCNMATDQCSTVTKNITITITDSEAREIFKQSKLFAIPTEMKQPPALLVYLRDVILRNY